MGVWFITGASRGFGMEIAREALARGHQVVATARRASSVTQALPENPSLLAVELDVTDAAQAAQAVQAAVDAFGRIDVVVNNAGRGLLAGVEEAGEEAVRAIFEANVFGTLNVLRAVLPVLRGQRSGHVINMSSVGGLTASAGWGIYGSTKYAVEGFSDALSQEVAPLGIHVTLVEPGYFRTDFLDGSSVHVEENVIADYEATAGKTRASLAAINHNQPGDPVKAAAAIVTMAESDKPPLRLLLGSDSVSRVEAKMKRLGEDMAAWREVSLSTDHDDV